MRTGERVPSTGGMQFLNEVMDNYLTLHSLKAVKKQKQVRVTNYERENY